MNDPGNVLPDLPLSDEEKLDNLRNYRNTDFNKPKQAPSQPTPLDNQPFFENNQSPVQPTPAPNQLPVDKPQTFTPQPLG